MKLDSRSLLIGALAVVAVAAIFGLSYVAGRVINDGGGGPEPAETVTVLELPPTAAPGVATRTPLPTRSSCDEIRGTRLRSRDEWQLYLTSCRLATPAVGCTLGAGELTAVFAQRTTAGITVPVGDVTLLLVEGAGCYRVVPVKATCGDGYEQLVRDTLAAYELCESRGGLRAVNIE